MDPSHTPLIGTTDASALDAGPPETTPESGLDRARDHGPTAFLIGSHRGTGSVANGWLVTHPIGLAALYWRVATRLNLRLRDSLGALWRAISGVAAMVAAVFALNAILPATRPPALTRLDQVVGGLTCIAFLLLFHRSRVDAVQRKPGVARGT